MRTRLNDWITVPEYQAGNATPVDIGKYHRDGVTWRILVLATRFSKSRVISTHEIEQKCSKLSELTPVVIFASSSGLIIELRKEEMNDTATGVLNTVSSSASESFRSPGSNDFVEIVDPSNPKNRTWVNKKELMPTKSLSEGTKYDQGKVGVDLLPVQPLLEIAAVLDYGAKKYAAWNWTKGISWRRVYGAILRHLWAWYRGEDLDPETGLSHLAHAGCNVLFLLQYIRTRSNFDDRPIKELS